MQINHMRPGHGRGHSISYSVKWLDWFLAGFGLGPLRTLCPVGAAACGADCQTCSRVQAVVPARGQAPAVPLRGHTTAPWWLHRSCLLAGLGPRQPGGAVRNRGAEGWEIPHAATGAHGCLLSMALLLPQEPAVEGSLSDFKRKKGFQPMKPCS